MLKIRDFLRCLPAVQLAISTSSSSLIKLLYKVDYLRSGKAIPDLTIDVCS